MQELLSIQRNSKSLVCFDAFYLFIYFFFSFIIFYFVPFPIHPLSLSVLFYIANTLQSILVPISHKRKRKSIYKSFMEIFIYNIFSASKNCSIFPWFGCSFSR